MKNAKVPFFSPLGASASEPGALGPGVILNPNTFPHPYIASISGAGGVFCQAVFDEVGDGGGGLLHGVSLACGLLLGHRVHHALAENLGNFYAHDIMNIFLKLIK